MMKSAICLVATIMVGMLQAKIIWSPAQNITGDADVSTNGVLRYACSWAETLRDALVVNGVPFTTDGRASGAGTDIENINMTGYGRVWGLVEPTEQYADCSANYLLALRTACNSGGGQTTTHVLKNLVPGRRYEVQAWMSSIFPEYVGVTLMVDGEQPVIPNTGASDAVAMGQHILGTFTCGASGEETFTIQAPPHGWPCLNAVQVRDISGETEVLWDEPQNITDESDVRTEGWPVYAYAQGGQDAIVNGVSFKGVTVGTAVPNHGGTEGYADVLYSLINDAHGTAFGNGDNGPTPEYQKLICGAAYGDQVPAADLMLRNLVPGRTYLCQIWMNDSRPEFAGRECCVAGRTLRYNAGTGYGQYIVGRFVAANTSQRIPFTLTNPSGNSMQWNALQVRELNPGGIAWERAQGIVDETSISDEGEPLYAYYWGGTEPLVVNGTTFDFGGMDPTYAGSVAFHGFLAVNKGNDFVPPQGAASGLSETMHALLNGGVYSAASKTTRVVLHHLEPGGHYLVQLFDADARDVHPLGQFVDGRTRINRNRWEGYPNGSTVIGRFVARATEQAFILNPQAAISSSGAHLSAQLNALQVRRIGKDLPMSAETKWEITAAQSAVDVLTEGSLKYAYTYAGGGLEVNGVAFTATGGGAAYGADVQLSPAFTATYNGYANNYGGTLPGDDPYLLLLANGAYHDGIDALDLTLANLEFGHAYAVQVWVSDTRPEMNARWWSPDETGLHCSYQPATGQFGNLATGRFRATATTKRVSLKFPTRNGQINAIQVRDLGEVSDVGDAAGDDPSRLVVAEGEKTADAISSEVNEVVVWGGSLALNATTQKPLAFYAADGATVKLGADATVAAATLEGTGAYQGPGTLVLDNPHQGVSAASFGQGVFVRKQGDFDWFFSGNLADATLVGANGRTVIAADQTGAVGLGGQIAFLQSTVKGELKVVGELTTTGLVMGENGTLVLGETESLHATDDLDLTDVTIRVTKQRLRPNRILVSGDARLIGKPNIVFEARNNIAEFDETINAWCTHLTGLTLYVR